MKISSFNIMWKQEHVSAPDGRYGYSYRIRKNQIIKLAGKSFVQQFLLLEHLLTLNALKNTGRASSASSIIQKLSTFSVGSVYTVEAQM